MVTDALQRVYRLLRLAGVDPLQTFDFVRGAPRFLRDVARYRATSDERSIPIDEWEPHVDDWFEPAGEVGGHYFHQDLWVARRLRAASPDEHVDVGSRLDGFVSILLTFTDVTEVDVRPLDSDVAGLTFVQDDATRLTGFPDDSVASLSTLHTAEHFGLGRYGDPVDANGHLRLFESLRRVLAPGGTLYLSVPVGRERTVFNAHRVFDPQTVLDAFDDLELVDFAGMTDDGDFSADYAPAQLSHERFGLGIFVFEGA